MGWYDREWYLGEHRSQVFDTTGNAGTTAWWNGRVVGGWSQDADGRVELRLLEDVGRDAKRALTRRAYELTEWPGGARSAHASRPCFRSCPGRAPTMKPLRKFRRRNDARSSHSAS